MKRVRIADDQGALEGEAAAMAIDEQKKYARLQLLGVVAAFGAIIFGLRLGGCGMS